METTLLIDNQNCIDFYTNILSNYEIKVSQTLFLDETFKKTTLSNSLFIIDVRDKNSLSFLKQLEFKSHAFCIFVTPFQKTHMELPSHFEHINSYFFTKPINIQRFQNILIEIKNEKLQKNYLFAKEELIAETIDSSPFRIGIYDTDGKLLYANHNYKVANNIQNINQGQTFDSIKNCKLELQEIKYFLKTHKVYIKEKKQDDKWFKSHFYYIQHGKNIVHLCFDITQEKQKLDNLKKTAEFFEQTSEAVLITDKDGVILAVNDAFCKITGYTKDEAVSKPTSLLSSGVHPPDFYQNLWEHLIHYGRWQGEIWNRRKNGEVYPEWLSISKLIDHETQEINYMAIFTDISSLKEADKKLHFYANHDHLTGLLNRIQFENLMNHTIESSIRNHKKFALLFIDLDYFKDVNDTHGHDIGDLVLKEVAARIRNSLRKEDIIARVGGDEFNAIITNIQEDENAIEVANNLNNSIKQPIIIKNKTFYLSLSIGISVFPKHGINNIDLAKNADQAMYEVKNNGRDGVVLYDHKITANLVNKVTLKNDLKKAIKNSELEVYYQPVFHLKTKKIFGAEALVRWKHPKKGFISPEKFVKVAEKHGMIQSLSKKVLETVYEDLPLILKRFGLNFKVAVNISSKEFSDPEFVEKIVQTTKDFHIDFRNIELEITETYIMQNHSEAVDKMHQLKEEGFTLAIDDFGTGYSSLSYLKSFPIDKLKIDKSFVLDILQDDDDKAIVETILHIAKIFQLDVQAEGIETISHLKTLQELGCDIAQGYHYSKPIPLNELLNFKEKIQ